MAAMHSDHAGGSTHRSMTQAQCLVDCEDNVGEPDRDHVCFLVQ